MKSDIVIIGDSEFGIIIYTKDFKMVGEGEDKEAWTEKHVFSSIIAEDKDDLPFYIRLNSEHKPNLYQIEISICTNCYNGMLQLSEKYSQYKDVFHYQERKIKSDKVIWLKIENIFNNRRIKLIESNHELLELEAIHVNSKCTFIS